MASPAALAGTKPKITTKSLIASAYASSGIVSLVAEHFGVTRAAIYKRLQDSPSLKEAFNDASEASLDLAEAKHLEAIRNGYYPAILFHLKTKGRERGYTTDQTISYQLSTKNTKQNADVINERLMYLMETGGHSKSDA